MTLAQTSDLGKTDSLFAIKSFLIWTFTLAVCLLVVGFPLVVLMATVASLLSVVLQSVMPMSAVLLVAGSVIALNILAVVVAAAALTMKGVHPNQMKWLSWLHGEAEQAQTSVYASCPLTCDIEM
jgi:energy-coupling factor transporter transmembrane protein EcfT